MLEVIIVLKTLFKKEEIIGVNNFYHYIRKVEKGSIRKIVGQKRIDTNLVEKRYCRGQEHSRVSLQ